MVSIIYFSNGKDLILEYNEGDLDIIGNKLMVSDINGLEYVVMLGKIDYFVEGKSIEECLRST